MKKKKIQILKQFKNIISSFEKTEGKIVKLNIRLINKKIKEIEVLVFNEKTPHKINNLIKIENCFECEDIFFQLIEILYKYINENDLEISEKIELLENFNLLLDKLKNIDKLEYNIKGILSLTFYLHKNPQKFLLTYEGKIGDKKVKIITEDIELLFPTAKKFKILYEI